MPGFDIRKARIADSDSIVGLYKKFNKYHKRKELYGKLKKNAEASYRKYIKKEVRNKNALVLVAEVDDQVIGYATFMISRFPDVFVVDKEVGLGEIFVEKKHRRKGVAKRLVEEGLEWGKKKGLRYANLEVREWNKNALEFYKKLGFRIRVYTMKNY